MGIYIFKGDFIYIFKGEFYYSIFHLTDREIHLFLCGLDHGLISRFTGKYMEKYCTRTQALLQSGLYSTISSYWQSEMSLSCPID